MDPISLTASFIAVIQLSASVTGYLKEVKYGSQERIKLREEVRTVACMLQVLNDRVEDAEDAERDLVSIRSLAFENGPLDQLRSALELLIGRLAPNGRLKQTSQPLSWPFRKGEIQDVLGTIERQKSTLSLAIENDTMLFPSGLSYRHTWGLLLTAAFRWQSRTK